MKRWWSALGLLGVCGCAMLPDGQPPAGAIVRQRTESSLTAEAAAEALTTRLVASSLAEFPGAKLCCEADPETKAVLLAAVREAGTVSGIYAVSTPQPWRIVGDSGSSFWEFTLFHEERMVWRETYWIRK